MALPVYTGPWDKRTAAHLVRRCLFGATPADIDNALGKGLVASVDELFAAPTPPPEPIAYVKSGGVLEGDPWASSTYDANTENQRLTLLQTWWIDLMLNQGFSVREKLTLFWANHFSTGANQVKDSRYMFKQNAMLRRNAFGSIKAMVFDVTLDPAMLRYLSGNTNTKAQPNENYGRELQELFTIGKGEEIAPGNYTNYTEADVKTAARVFTGWTDIQSTLSVRFSSAAHDASDKTFTSAYGARTIAGRTGEVGARQEITDIITMIFDQTETARYYVRRLYRWFVDYRISSDTERDVIEPLAQTLRSSNYNVVPVLKELFISEHFYNSERIGCAIKTPADLVIGTTRLFHPPDLYPLDQKLMHWAYRTVRRTMATMQMDLFNPPNVAGWPAYYQSPMFHEIWINADTLQKRVKFTSDLSLDGLQLDESYDKSYIDTFFAANLTQDPSNASTLVSDLAGLMFAIPLTSEQLQTLTDIVLQGQPATAWTYTWNQYEADPANDNLKAPIEARLRMLLKTMMNMAEYQIC